LFNPDLQTFKVAEPEFGAPPCPRDRLFKARPQSAALQFGNQLAAQITG
jgi:hypothetical protein